jgi:hypothetical protein
MDSVIFDKVSSDGNKYHILAHPSPMDRAELTKKFRGLWVFTTNRITNEHHGLVSCIPRIVAENSFVGVCDGIYDAYKDASIYGETGEFDDRPVPDVPMLF